jgi:superoxide reductase
MGRRNFIKLTTTAGLTSLTGLYLPKVVLAKSDIINSPLAGKVFYTENNPGRWNNKVKGHLPTFVKTNKNLEITTGHEMNGYEHYIIKHMLFDEKFNLFNEVMFNPNNDAPISNHDISKLNNKIYALSLCNKHDAWLNSYII